MVVGILIGIIIMLVVFIGLFATNTINFSSKTNENDNEQTNSEEVNENEKNGYSYEQMEGLYSYTDEESDGELAGLVHDLYLYENGTYVYKMPARTRYGQIGNYIISDNVIYLNSLFSFNSGVGINSYFENKTLTIQNLKELKLDTITLIKDETKVEDFKKNYDFNTFIENNPITNKYSTSVKR